ncbi:MAG: redoxin domain-containing protein [Candidatus Acidiferrales bacterium]
MRLTGLAIVFVFAAAPLPGQTSAAGPTSEKAQKTYKQAVYYLNQRMEGAALDSFKKADKQDGGHCAACQEKMIKYGLELQDWKTAELAAQESVADARTAKDIAVAHYEFGVILTDEGLQKNKADIFARAHDEFTKALAAAPNFPQAVFDDGRALAHMNQDDAAKQRFEQYLKLVPEDTPQHGRALRYISDPDLVRARMAPPFAVTTMDGKNVSLDELKGNVILIDFWATWCVPCREALPHVQEIAKKFQGQPLVILSVSLDDNEQAWKDFVAKNEMTWLNYRDGGFTGPVARLYGVNAIPHTFTIDADGVLQDEHIGDAALEGRLKKLVKRAAEEQTAEGLQQAAHQAPPQASSPSVAP